jgi:predicted site-specific integrase-resolvase
MHEVDTMLSPKEMSTKFGVSTNTLSRWAKIGKIQSIKTSGGHNRYIEQQCKAPAKKKFIYARVSSVKQSEDLQRQIAFLQASHPHHEIIKDIGSGLNFKRRGLGSILDAAFAGNVSEIVVAHRDRLCRFGFDLLKQIFAKLEVSITVLSDQSVQEPTSELADDLLSIITVFTARYYGSRKYRKRVLQEDQNLSKPTTSQIIQ